MHFGRVSTLDIDAIGRVFPMLRRCSPQNSMGKGRRLLSQPRSSAGIDLPFQPHKSRDRASPIERIAELERRFDLIVCTGVLHHLVDADAGLRALRSVLKSEGSMYLMVYAPYGRTGVYMLQDYCRRLGIGTSEREICDLMAVLKALPQQHPLAALLSGSRDAANPDALADALLNPRDRSY